MEQNDHVQMVQKDHNKKKVKTPEQIARGQRIRHVRTTLEMSLADFGGICGVSQRSQQWYESGDRSPDADYLDALFRVFMVDLGYLITGEDLAAATKLNASEQSLVARYRSLDKHSKSVVDNLMDLAGARQRKPT